MAEVLTEERREFGVTPTELAAAHPRMSWGAIFAGAVSALGLWLLLYVFGLAIGLSTVNESSFKPAGVFTGIWALITPLVALFVGGWVAGRGAGIITRPVGGVHGLVVWALTALAGVMFVFTLASALIGGVFQVGKGLVQAGGQAAGGAAQAVGIDADQVLAPINQRLQSEGKPPVTADQLRAATKDAMQSAAAQGGLNRETLVQAIAANTSLSQADAEQLADRVHAQYEQKKAELAAGAKAGAAKAAEQSSKAFWGAFAALLLGLAASVAGGIVGAGFVPGGPRRTRVVTHRTLAPPREVYP